jgi:hypothetical protein
VDQFTTNAHLFSIQVSSAFYQRTLVHHQFDFGEVTFEIGKFILEEISKRLPSGIKQSDMGDKFRVILQRMWSVEWSRDKCYIAYVDLLNILGRQLDYR